MVRVTRESTQHTQGRRRAGRTSPPRAREQSSNPHETDLSASGLRRRLKRHLLKVQQSFLATCAPGLEPFLEREIVALPGALACAPIKGGVEFAGPLDLVYHANVRLRSANRVLLRIADFHASSYPELYDKARRIAWERYVGFGERIAFDISAHRSRIRHAGRIEKALLEAIQRVMGRLGIAVESDTHAPLRIFARLARDHCTVSIDSSGELLHRRGYRQATAKAPIRETVAAALFEATEAVCFPVVADPFCGSGTFAVEAAMAARGVAPGMNRTFAFEQWPSFVAGKLERLRAALCTSQLPKSPLRIVASDINQGALRATRSNAERAGVSDDIEISHADALSFNHDGRYGRNGLLIANLPYGRRIGEEAAVAELWRAFDRRLAESCRGWHAGTVLPRKGAGVFRNLKPVMYIPFVHGGIAVEFVYGPVKDS
jgi:putative N6-adenine-specific DNA methylase